MCNNSKYKELEEFIHQQESKESALISVLHKAQQIFGYLGEEVQNFVADRLSIPVSKVYGVISFYSYFTTEPKGKYVISICTGTACFVRGSGEIVEEFKRKLNIKEGETTPDGLYTIDTLRCVGACGLAPVVMVNNRVYGHFTKADINKVLEEYK
jgi:NADH-quinone oxidoreductase subunit E